MRLFCSLLNYTSFPASPTRAPKIIISSFAYFLRVWDCNLVIRAEALKPRRAWSLGSVTLSKWHALHGFHVYFCAKGVVGGQYFYSTFRALEERYCKISKRNLIIIHIHIPFQFVSQVFSMGISIPTKLQVSSNKTDYSCYLFKVLLHQINWMPERMVLGHLLKMAWTPAED